MILSLTSPQTIESIDLGTSTPRLSGVIDVSRFANLVGLSANENDIQNFIFPPNNNLEEISLYDNKLQGSVNQYIPLDIKKISLDNNVLTSISSLSSNINLEDFRCSENAITGSLPDISLNLSLKKFEVKNNNLTGFNGGTVSSTLLDFKANNNNLSATAVNAILAAFVAAGSSNGILDLGGSGNAAPSGQGITDKATLISRNWNVQTN